jgi:hypothetical protein
MAACSCCLILSAEVPAFLLVRSSNVAWRVGARTGLQSGSRPASRCSRSRRSRFRAAVSEVTGGLSQRCGAHPGGRGSGPPSSTSQMPAQSVLPVLGGAIFLWETDDVPCSQQAGPYARSKARVHAHQNEIRLSCVPPLRASPEAVLSEQGFHSRRRAHDEHGCGSNEGTCLRHRIPQH